MHAPYATAGYHADEREMLSDPSVPILMLHLLEQVTLHRPSPLGSCTAPFLFLPPTLSSCTSSSLRPPISPPVPPRPYHSYPPGMSLTPSPVISKPRPIMSPAGTCHIPPRPGSHRRGRPKPGARWGRAEAPHQRPRHSMPASRGAAVAETQVARRPPRRILRFVEQT